MAGTTVNRFCGSSMTAVHIAAGQIQLGAGEVFVCAGVESMTRVPMIGFNPMPNPNVDRNSDANAGAVHGHGRHGGERRAASGRSRAPSRRRSRSQPAAGRRGAEGGRFKDEIVPIAAKAGDVDCRRLPRAPTRRAKGSAGLKPAFDQEGT